ncbi:MAG: hypothetical protein JKY45_11645, partial [Emcibacter sp.]|nr:hypothetical protein [Emcibacter sp.]
TYWRSPGDVGLPPRWTWKNIENIHGITVNWPKPEFMRIFDMDTYIYHDEVILPIEVKITDEQKVTSLALGLEYMICEEICVPQEGSYRLDISSLENIKILPFQKAQLDRYRELVPLKKSSDNVRVKLDGDQGNMVMIKLSEDFINVSHIIVEGPDSILFEQAFTNDNGYFQVRYRGKRSALEGQEITLTLLLKGGGAHEMTVTVQR